MVCVFPLFQNCGQQMLHGNGDPYENGGNLGLDPGFTNELDGVNNLPGELIRGCTGSGNIAAIQFFQTDNSTVFVSFRTWQQKERSVKIHPSQTSVPLDVTFDSGIKLKHLNIAGGSVSVDVVVSGVTSVEQLACAIP